jgi:subtilisin family serine protease
LNCSRTGDPASASFSTTVTNPATQAVESANVRLKEDLGDAYVENEVLVVLNDNVESDLGMNFFKDLPLRTVRTAELHWGTLHRMAITDGTPVPEMVDRLRVDPGVRIAEPNYLLVFQEAPYFPNDPLWEGSDPGNDPRDSVYDQWGPAKLGASIVWNDTKGSSDVIVAVIDTGIRLDHEDLQANIWINEDEIPDNGIDDDGNGWTDDWRGWDSFGGDNDPSDTDSHGTGCSGIIGAVQDNNKGLSGIAPGVKIMAMRADMWDGPSCVETVVEAWDYVKKNGADIVSMSFIVLYPTEVLETAANDTWDNGNGPVLIAAAGNWDTLDQYVPASYDSVICVGATVPWSRYNVPVDEDRIHKGWADWWWGSNYGPNLDVMGFGEKTVTTYSASTSSYRTGYSNGFFNGTSCATPTVAGVMALIVSANPGQTGQWYWDRLEQTADDLDVPGYDIQTGNGRVNALRGVYGPDRFKDLEDVDGFVPITCPGTTVYDSIHDAPGNPYNDKFDLYHVIPDSTGCLGVSLDIFTWGEDLDMTLYADRGMTHPLCESVGENHASSSYEFLSLGVSEGAEYFLSVYSPEIGNSTTYGLSLDFVENSVMISGESTAPVSVVPGEKFVPVLELQLDVTCQAELDQVMVHKHSTRPGPSQCPLYLFWDSNYSGTFDWGDMLIASDPDFEFNSTRFSDLALPWTSRQPLTLFVLAGFLPVMTPGTEVYFSLENYKDIEISGGIPPPYNAFPIRTDTITLSY